MTSVAARVLLALAMLAALGAGQTARADGPLPIKQGSYVQAEVPCNEASNASRIYYEKLEESYGISWPHSACTISQVSKKENVYYIIQKCVFKGIEGIVKKQMRIKVNSDTSFTILYNAEDQKWSKKKEQVYRWCQD